MSVQINLTDNELKAVETYAAQTGISIDAYIKRALLNYIEQAEETEDEPFVMKGLEEIKQDNYADGKTFIDGLIGKYDNV